MRGMLQYDVFVEGKVYNNKNKGNTSFVFHEIQN